jgi:hypothetical protein
LISILKSFRKKSYPIIVTLTSTLNDRHQIKDTSFRKLKEGMKNTSLKIKQVLPEWSIESKIRIEA